MISLLSVIILLALCFALLSLLIPESKADEFWLVRVFWNQIGKPIRDRMLNRVSVGRVVIEYFVVSAAIIGGPFFFTNITAYWKGQPLIHVNFDQIGIVPLICFILLTLILAVYLFLNYKLKRLKQTSEEYIKTVISADEDLGKLLNKYEDSIQRLHVNDAHSYLEEIRKIIANNEKTNYKLLSKVDFLLAQCLRFGKFTNSTVKYRQAYLEMKKAKDYSIDIVSGYAYSLIKQGKIVEAKEICKTLHDKDSENKVFYLFLLASSKDLKCTFSHIPEHIRNDHTFLAEAFPFIVKSHDETIFDMDGFNYTLPSKIDFKNLNVWIFYISISINKMLKYEGYLYFGGEHHSDYLKEVYKVTDEYLLKAQETDVKGLFQDIDIFHTYTKFFIVDNSYQRQEDIKFMLSYKPSQNNVVSYLMMTVEMLMVENKEDETVTLLGKYNNVKHESVTFLWIVLAYRYNNVEYARKAIDSYVNDGYKIPSVQSIFVINTVITQQSSVLKNASKLKFEDPLVQEVFNAVIRFIKTRTSNVDALIKLAKVCPKDHVFYIADILAKSQHIEQALQILRPVASTKVQSFNLQLYIDLLRMNNERLELYHVLKDSRKNIENFRSDYLSIEFQLAIECNDIDDANEVISELYSKKPNDISTLYNYCASLLEQGKNDEFEKLVPQITGLKDIDNDSLTMGFTRQLLKAGKIEESVQFLYDQVTMHKTQTLKDFYFRLSLTYAARDYMSKSKEIVEVGDYVIYKEKGEKKEDLIFRNSVLEPLIGHKKGEVIIIIRFNEISSVEILDVRSKYFALAKECINDIQRGTSKAGKMISLEELKGKDGDIWRNLAKLTGAEENKKTEEDFENRYSKGKASFLAETSIDNAFKDCFNRMFGNKIIYTLPYQYYSKQSIGNIDYILDLSSVLLLCSLTVKFDFHYTKKFFIPQGLKLYIQHLMDQEKLDPLSFLYPDAIAAFGLKENKNEPLSISVLKTVRDWIENNCESRVVEKLLELHSDGFKQEGRSFFLIEAESLLLTMDTPTVLLTEDWGLSVSLARNFRTMNSIAMLILTGKIINEPPLRFLADIHFAGIPVTESYMYDQYKKKIAKLTNSFDSCLEGLRVNSLLNDEGIKLTLKILHQKIKLPQDNIVVIQILKNILDGLPTNVLNLFKAKIMIVNNKDLTYCYNEALKLSNVIITR